MQAITLRSPNPPKAIVKQSDKTDKGLFAVLSASFLLGMAVALMVYFWWRFEPNGSQFHELLRAAALVICPPYILSFAVSANPESDLALVLTLGTIIFANGFLYAGVGASVYFLLGLIAKKRTRHD